MRPDSEAYREKRKLENSSEQRAEKSALFNFVKVLVSLVMQFAFCILHFALLFL
jgi:hypothetical protein